MNSTEQIYFFVVEAYPTVGASSFLATCSAYVTFWISKRTCADEQSALNEIRSRLQAIAWKMVCVDLSKIVTASSYPVGTDGRDHFIQAQTDGTVVVLHNINRELVGVDGMEITEAQEAFVNFSKTRMPPHLYYLAHERNGPVITFSTDSETTYLPIWREAADAEPWLESNPGAVLKRLALRTRTGQQLLTETHKHECSVGLFGSSWTGLTCHPIWLAQQSLNQ